MMRNFSKTLFNVGFAYLIGIFAIYMLTVTGFLFHISINIFYPIIGIILGMTTLYFQGKSENLSKRYIIISYVIYFLLIMLFAGFSLITFDNGYDGLWFHQGGMILLNEGYNPVYNNIYEFAQNLYDTDFRDLHWIECYPKFVEITVANIFKLTHYIETGKILTFLSIFIAYSYMFKVLNKDYFNSINKFYKIIIPFLLIINPVVIEQFLTYFIDDYVYLYFMIILTAIIDIETDNKICLKPWIIFVMSGTCLINIKLGGVVYLITTLLLYGIYLIIKKNRTNLKYFAISLLCTICLTILSGINPYYTNIHQGKHILHPLMGEEKIDIMSGHYATKLQNKNYLHQFLISSFARMDNIMARDQIKKVHLKVPFWVYKSELSPVEPATIRICGFGVFWSGILILSIFLAFLIRYKKKEEKQLGLLIFSILLTLFLINPYSWWARYAPHLWAIPVMIILFNSFNNTNKTKNILLLILTTVMISNSLILCIPVNEAQQGYRKIMRNRLRTIQQSKETIKLYCIRSWGIVEKLRENNIKFEVVNEEYFKYNKDEFSPITYWGPTQLSTWEKIIENTKQHN